MLEKSVELAIQGGAEDKINDRKRVLRSFIASYCR
jgi:cyanophycinase-like exopeptidase